MLEANTRSWDGLASFESGVDSGLSPSLIPKNKLRWGYNTTMRGGTLTHRPGFNQRTINFAGDARVQTRFETKRWQGGFTYRSDSGTTYLVCSIGGRIFRIDPVGYTVLEITPRITVVTTAVFVAPAILASVVVPVNYGTGFTSDPPSTTVMIAGVSYTVNSSTDTTVTLTNINDPPGTPHAIGSTFIFSVSLLPVVWWDLNSDLLTKAWFCQAEQFLFIQDGTSRCIIFDGVTARRSSYTASEVPTGKMMTYGLGRLWVAVGNYFVGGDLVFSSSGTPAYSFRDAVFKFTENNYIAGGGAFYVPMQTGEITGMAFSSQQGTATGEGELKVYTKNAVFSVSVPADRAEWNTVTDPTQKVSVLHYGTVSHESIVTVNGDAFFRSTDGIRSYVVAQRYFGQWGNTPLSREMKRALDYESNALIEYESAVLFDNRLLMTCWPQYLSQRGNPQTGIMVMDFDLISGLSNKLPPVWEGVWTGLSTLRLITARINEIDRCFAFCLSVAGVIQIWEISKADKFDNNSTNIVWEFETGALGGNTPKQLYALDGGDTFIEDIAGTVTFDLDYAPDQHECWYDWSNWSKCGNYRDCAPNGSPTCTPLHNWKPQYRARMTFPAPPESCNTAAGTLSTFGYEFRAKLRVTGHCVINTFRLRFQPKPESFYDGCETTEACRSLECCPSTIP